MNTTLQGKEVTSARSLTSAFDGFSIGLKEPPVRDG